MAVNELSRLSWPVAAETGARGGSERQSARDENGGGPAGVGLDRRKARSSRGRGHGQRHRGPRRFKAGVSQTARMWHTKGILSSLAGQRTPRK